MAEPESFDIRIENPVDANEVYVFTDTEPNGYEDYYYRWIRNEPSEAMIKLDMAYNRYFERIEEGWEMLVSFKNVAGEYEQYFKGVVMETRKADQSVTIIALDYMDELANIQLNEVIFYESHLQKGGATKPGYYDGFIRYYYYDTTPEKYAILRDQDGTRLGTADIALSPLIVKRNRCPQNLKYNGQSSSVQTLTKESGLKQAIGCQFTLTSFIFDVWFPLNILNDKSITYRFGIQYKDATTGRPDGYYDTVDDYGDYFGAGNWYWHNVSFDLTGSGAEIGEEVFFTVHNNNATPEDSSYRIGTHKCNKTDGVGASLAEGVSTWLVATGTYMNCFISTTDNDDDWELLADKYDYELGTFGSDITIDPLDNDGQEWPVWITRYLSDGDPASTGSYPVMFKCVYYYNDGDDLLVSDAVDKIVKRTNHLTPSISGAATTTKIKIASFIGVKGLTALKNLAIVSGSEFYVDGSDNLKFEDVYEITVPETYAFYNKNDDPQLVSGGSWGDTGGAEPAVKYSEIISSNLKRKTHIIANKVVVIGDTQGENVEPPIAVAQNFNSQTTMGIVKTRTVSDKSILTVDDAYNRARELLEENLAYQIKLTVAGQYPWLVRTGFSVLDTEIGLPSWTEFKIERITVQPLTTKIDGSKLVTNIAQKLSETKDDVLMSSMFRSPLPGEITNYVTASTTSWGYTPDHCKLMDSNGSEHGSADLTLLSTGVYYAFFDKNNGQHYNSQYLLDRVKVYNSGETQSVTLNVIDAGEKFYKTSNMKTIVYIYFTNIVTCGSYCETHCQTSCERTCMQTCQLSCEVGSCETSCLTECEVTYCQTSCESTCQGTCLTSCQMSCMSACQATCETQGCQTWCELKSCDTTCQLECQDACQLSCESACQGFCEYSCQSACQSGIEA